MKPIETIEAVKRPPAFQSTVPDGYDPYGKDATKLGHRDGPEPVYRLVIGEDGGIKRVEQVPEDEILRARPEKKRPPKRNRSRLV